MSDDGFGIGVVVGLMLCLFMKMFVFDYDKIEVKYIDKAQVLCADHNGVHTVVYDWDGYVEARCKDGVKLIQRMPANG